jgi:putative transposase
MIFQTTHSTHTSLVPCKLVMIPQQRQHLDNTLQAFADACNYIWEYAQQNQVSRQWHLHQACYQHIRKNFNLPANLAIRAIARVAPLLRKRKSAAYPFVPNLLVFDSRIFKLYKQGQLNWSLSITLLGGREKFELDLGAHQMKMLKDKDITSAILLKKYKSYYLDIPIKATMYPAKLSA